MNEGTISKKRLRTALKLVVSYLIVVFFHYHIDKFTKGYIIIPLALFYSVLTVVFFIKFIKTLVRTLLLEPINKYVLITLILYLFAFAGIPYAWINKKIPSSELFESKVVLKGCFEGTMNQANLKFRADSTFELHWTGAFLGNAWYYGKWHGNNDTITIVNDGIAITPLNDTLILVDTLRNQFFIPYADNYKTIFDNRWFYKGDCKGYN
ncbi:MAG: hypothetical protein R2800_12665 [Flavipsychrobacter sp.]